MAQNIINCEEKSEFICNVEGEKIKIEVPKGGIHFVYNALASIMVGKLLGINNNQIKNGIESFKLTKNRMDITKLENGVTIINDSYNSNFESIEAILKYFKDLKYKRKIAVLGDILEAGKFSENLHQEVGKVVSESKIDILICSGKYSKYIVEEANKHGMKEEQIYYFNKIEEIEEQLKQIWKDGDAILFKASNGMKFFKIVESLLKEERGISV